MKKNLGAITLSAILLGTSFALAACGEGEPQAKGAYVSLDINPAIELIVDEKNQVVSVRGENEDGQVLLYEETGIEGASIDDAIAKITDLAIEYGYLDEENKVIDTLIASDDDEFASELLEKVNATVSATAANLGLSVTTDGKGAYSLLRKMEEIKNQFPNNAAIQSMSVQKFKLALSVSEKGDLSLEAAAELDDSELIQKLKELHPQIEAFATDAYEQAKIKALAVYEQATQLAVYGVYTQFYLEKVLTHPLTAYYGGVYQMYASAAKGFDVVCDVAELGAKAEKYPFSEEQIDAVVSALGMQSSEPLKNADGEVTVQSIEAYADRLFKNTPASDALEQTKNALSEALASAELVIKEKVSEMAAEYKPQVERAVESARQILTSVETAFSVLPSSVISVLNTATADLKDVLTEFDAILEGETLDVKVLREKANFLQQKADEYLDLIEKDLSEEELAAIEERKASVINGMQSYKTAFEQALDEAANAAKEYLTARKDARKNGTT